MTKQVEIPRLGTVNIVADEYGHCWSAECVEYDFRALGDSAEAALKNCEERLLAPGIRVARRKAANANY